MIAPAATLAFDPPRRSLRQNWVLDPVQDTVFILAAPVLALGAALLLFWILPAADAITKIGLSYVVFTVAHHVPTFLRIYGDTDLFRRFKWTFLLGPVIPFVFSLSVLGYLLQRGAPLEHFFTLFIILTLWDPWHFLMQHYGFMRIYDRPNTAPARLAARMDLMLCSVWFVFIMLAGGDWLPNLLLDLQARANIPLLEALPIHWLPVIIEAAGVVAALATIAYGVYLHYCWRHGYYISPAKLILSVVTFGAMYVAYTPNPLILWLVPEWTFKVGFAVLGLVHVSQYLAIVWKYNRSLATRPHRARPGLFENLHRRGGPLIALGYIALCLLYGEILTVVQANQWIVALLLAIGFTSTLLHYYFDGFIWKMRHSQNVENLASDGETREATQSVSWWNSHRPTGPAAVLLRQALYFGLPMAILTAGAAVDWGTPALHYTEHVRQVQALNLSNQPGARVEMLEAARAALAAMNRELPIARRLAQAQPSAANQAALAFLIFTQSQYRHTIIPALEASGATPDQAAQKQALLEASALLKRSLAKPDSVSHKGREQLDRPTAARFLAQWEAALSK